MRQIEFVCNISAKKVIMASHLTTFLARPPSQTAKVSQEKAGDGEGISRRQNST